MFHIESNQLNLPEVSELINSLTKDIIDLKVSITLSLMTFSRTFR
jgi:hypothetical protein